jgi:outer membrane protein assembly factor BamD (BamD/ComL family)
MALDCLILPAPVEVVQRVITMLDNTAATPPWPSTEFIRGLADYREGQFARAAVRLEKALNFQSNTNTAMQARLILAMARCKLGKADDTPIPADKQFTLNGGDWNEQMTTLLFAHEARSVLVK